MKLTSLCLLIVLFSACSLKKTGEKTGEAVGQFIKGASGGVQNSFNVEVKLSPELKAQGIELGKVIIANDTLGVDNLVSVYCIFNKDFQDTVLLKAYDNQKLETGRSRLVINARKDEAGFYDFAFDRRTNLDSEDCRLILQ
jgi:hypothetical protein